MTTEQPVDLHARGQRIEQLLEASAAAGPAARERAEELVRLVVELYGEGLERLLDIVYDAGVLDAQLLDELADDPVVSNLLIVHGLHPYDVVDRIERALARVRPYLGSHGGDVALVGVTDDGIARLRMLGSCDGCPSSAATLTLAVEGAIRGAAPEVVAIEVEEAPAPQHTGGVIPVDALTARLHRDDGAAGGATWVAVPALDDVPDGRVLAAVAGGVDIVVCRVGSDRFAYRDGCAACGATLAGAPVERALGAPAGTLVLTCRECRARFDIRRAGAALDPSVGHLAPLPLLERDGVVEVAVPQGVAAATVPA